MRGASLATRAATGLAIVLLGGPALAAAQVPSRLDARLDRGKALVTANCASCHAVGSTGASPNRRAPPFRAISGRYVGLTLHRKLTEIGETGHYDMPPVPVHTDEVDAIAAYINSLEPSGEPPRP